MLAVAWLTWFMTVAYFKVKGFMTDQSIGDPNDPQNPYCKTTVKEFNQNLGL